MGVPEVLVLEDGDAVILEDGLTRVERDAVPAGYVYVDGAGVGDVRESLLRERARLGDDGVVVVSVTLDPVTGRLVGTPRLISHGFTDDASMVLDEVAGAVRAAAEEDRRRFRKDAAGAVRQVARKVIKAETGRRPVILPVVAGLEQSRRRRR